MLQLHNRSPFVPGIFGMPDYHGIDTLVVVIKATFEFGPPPRIAEQQRELVLADEYWGDPTASSLRYPSEIHLAKPGTDVIVIGDACAPRAQPVPELDVAVRVAARTKRARIYGDRYWTEGFRAMEPSLPRPFVRMPLTYERAYGGRHSTNPHSGEFVAEPRNPVGVGFVGWRSAEEMLGQPVPNLDDPDDPLIRLGQAPQPTGFAALAPTWHPRVAYVGTYDDHWRKHRAPFLPEDFDPRYFRVASPGLSFDQALQGGEPVTLEGFDPDGTWQFALPRCRFELTATVAGAREPMNPVLDTLLFEPGERRLSMTWRASLAVDERLLRVERVDVGLAEIDGALEPQGGQA